MVANRGQPLADKSGELNRLARLVVPPHTERIPAPRITEETQPGWPDFFRFQSTLLEIFTSTGLQIAHRVVRALFWLDLVEKAGSAGMTGPGLDEVLGVLSKSAGRETPRDLFRIPAPGNASRSPSYRNSISMTCA